LAASSDAKIERNIPSLLPLSSASAIVVKQRRSAGRSPRVLPRTVMGIYDRDYYRKEGPGFLGSFTSRAPICKWLILINIAFFILQLATLQRDGGGRLVGGDATGPVSDALILSPQAVFHGEVWRLLSYAFLHSTKDIWHIVFNMLMLWWMGHELEEMYGSREFLALYLTSAVFAGLCFLAHGYVMGNMVGLGASGAVVALTVVFACHYPNRTMLLFFVIPMPLWALVAFFVGYDFLVFVLQIESRTAVSAHLGGALFGYVYYRFHWRLTGLFSGLGTWREKQARPRLRIFRDEEPTPATVPASAPAEHEIDEHFEAKLDAVLEKMSLVGKDNLTDHEKDILLRASELYRRRRN
jgi:membrane associated rhomboid family serine protease